MADDKYTEQQFRFVEVYLELSRGNDNYTEVSKLAKEAAGYAESTSTYNIIKSVKDLIIEGANLRLAQMIPKMLNRLEDVVDNPARPGAANILNAADKLLEKAGVIKAEKINVEVKAANGVLILPAKVEVASE